MLPGGGFMGPFSIGAEIQPEFQGFGLNPFLEVLETRFQKEAAPKPIQSFHHKFKQLERAAQGGDLKAWQAMVPELKALAAAAGMEWEENLDLQVKLQQLELGLLLQAGKMAQRKAASMEKQAERDQIKAPPSQANPLYQQAKRYHQLGEQLFNQLRNKMGR